MKTEFYCEICTAPMVFIERLSNHVTKRANCRRRRFKCSICDFEKVIYSGGQIDENITPNSAVEKSKQIFKQEETNRL